MDFENTTSFETETLTLNDEKGRDLLLVLVKGTWNFDMTGTLTFSDEQDPVELADQYYGEPDDSSIYYASDFSYDKPATDIAMAGSVYAMAGPLTEQIVTLSVGSTEKTLIVYGDRWWKGVGIYAPSKPEPFESMPLAWERAYGGKDDSAGKEKHHGACEENPVGLSYRSKGSKLPIKDEPVPNIIDPHFPLKGPGKCKAPGGFGFIGPSWLPRRDYAGTYDEEWQKNRMPLLPDDFDFRFFNAAHPDLIYDGYLQGGEPIIIEGVWGNGSLITNVPSVSVSVEVEIGGEKKGIPLVIDTLFIDTDQKKINLVLSGALRVDGSMDDIEKVLYQ